MQNGGGTERKAAHVGLELLVVYDSSKEFSVCMRKGEC